MRTPRYVFGILVLTTALALRADTLKLKDGTMLEGEVTAEDNSTISIYLEYSRGTITQTRRIDKADIAEIIRWTPEQKETWRLQHDYDKLQAYRLKRNDNYLLEYYDQAISSFQKFLNDHPDSTYTSNVTARIGDWKAERALVSAGNIKFRGRWSPAAEVGPLITPERGRKFLEQSRWLISQRRFESAIPGLQVVAHMKDHPELASQAKPLLGSAYRGALVSLEYVGRQLSNDLVAAAAQVAQAREAVSDAEFPLKPGIEKPPTTSKGATPQTASAQATLDKAREELNAAEDYFERLQNRSTLVAQRLATLNIQAHDVTDVAVVSQSPPTQSTPSAPSSDSPEVLVTLVAWVKKNWPAMLIGLLLMLYLISRFAKD